MISKKEKNFYFFLVFFAFCNGLNISTIIHLIVCVQDILSRNSAYRKKSAFVGKNPFCYVRQKAGDRITSSV
jgi:hypothetical protein